MSRLSVPVITTVLGEGGSGGALAIGVGDVVLMLENSVYSVITPEGCAAILWKDSGQAVRAAESLKLTARDLLDLKIIDRIVPEPAGGAHVSVDETAALLSAALDESLREVISMSTEERLRRRYSKLRALGY